MLNQRLGRDTTVNKKNEAHASDTELQIQGQAGEYLPSARETLMKSFQSTLETRQEVHGAGARRGINETEEEGRGQTTKIFLSYHRETELYPESPESH